MSTLEKVDEEIPYSFVHNVWDGKKFMIYSSIGAIIRFSTFDYEIFGKGIVIMIGSLIVRCIAAKLSLTDPELNAKEKSFMTYSSIPKAEF